MGRPAPHATVSGRRHVSCSGSVTEGIRPSSAGRQMAFVLRFFVPGGEQRDCP